MFQARPFYFTAGLFSALLLFSFSGISATTEVRHLSADFDDYPMNRYYLNALELALEKTKDEGEFKLVPLHHPMNQKRQVATLIKSGDIDVIWAATTKNREQRAIPIRIPLLKGLLGHRISLLPKNKPYVLQSITSLNGLAKLTAGQGEFWADTKILRDNGLKVMPAQRYKNMFKMLSDGRFDYFPRSIIEVWTEVETHGELDLVVDDTILLRYRLPVYFFLDKSNAALAARIERGLRVAIKDGSFDALFYSYPAVKKAMEQTHYSSRKVFDLINQDLPPLTPIEDKRLWHHTEQ